MIINKNIEITWSARTKNHFVDKGYVFTNLGDTLLINVNDLTEGSKVRVDVLCDYCKRTLAKTYARAIREAKESIIGKHACKDCIEEKIEDEIEEKNRRGLLTRGDSGYWTFKENRDYEFHRHIENYGTIDNISEMNSGLYCAFKKYEKGTLEEVLTSLGYVWDDISSIAPRNYYRDINNVKKVIQPFINIYGRFPTSVELIKDLGIQHESVSYHGGIDKLKIKLDYSDKNDLLDDSGYKNKSIMEYTVAQFLIKNQIPHKREIMPFIETRHRCDFLIRTENNSYFVEVWGYDKEGKSNRSIEYNKTRRIKEELYSKNNLHLISIEFDEVSKMGINEIQKYLASKLSVLKRVKLLVVDDEDIIHPHWNKEKIFELFSYISQVNKNPIKKTEIIEQGSSAVLEVLPKLYSTYSTVPAKVDFYYSLLEQDFFIHPRDINLLRRVSLGRENKYTTEGHVRRAKVVLKYIESRQLEVS